MTRKLILTGALGALALTASPAAAHVTVQPDTATPGDYTVVSVRVPNETDDADTTRVDVQLPPGFASVSYQQVPGWSVKVKKEKLTVPIKTDDGDITEGVSEVSFVGDGKTGKIPPGAFQDFPLSILVPGKVGQTLTFKAVQKYDDGETVRWIGAPDADDPAPTVKLVAAGGEPAAPAATTTGATPTGEEGAAGTEKAAAGHSGSSSDDGTDSDGLAIAALIVGSIGVVLGAGGLASGRRKAAA